MQLILHFRVKENAVLPLVWPVVSTDGKKQIKDVPVEKGDTVFLSIYAANRLKTIWGEDADEWKPERWLKPLPELSSEERLPGVYSSM